VANDDLASLLQGAASGDQHAWDVIVSRYERLVWATIRSTGLDPTEAQDVSQITWARLVQKIGEIREPEALGGWLATTARREAIRAVTRSRRALPSEDLDLLPAEGSADAFLGSELIKQDDEREVSRALALVPERCRRLLRLWSLDPRPSYKEISAALDDMPVGSIGPTLDRCLGRLKTALGWGVSGAPDSPLSP
jgi:RNA polymerase sigma factor (sigma-70 family)